jgi:hypothetical protein
MQGQAAGRTTDRRLECGFQLFEHFAEGVGTRLSLNLGEFRGFEEGISVVDATGEYHFDNH